MEVSADVIKDHVETLRRSIRSLQRRRERLDERIHDCEEKLRGMEIAMGVLGIELPETVGASQSRTTATRSRGWADRVRAAVREFHKPFTPNELASAMAGSEEAGASTDIEIRVRKILARLVRDESEPVEVLEPGSGRKPTVYRNKFAADGLPLKRVTGRLTRDETDPALANLRPS